MYVPLSSSASLYNKCIDKKKSTCVQITVTPSGLRRSDLGCVKSAPTFAACSSPPWGLLPSAACLTSLIAFALRRPPVSHACFIGCSPSGALFDTSLIFGAPRVWFRLFLTSSRGCLLAAHPFLRSQHKSNCALVPDYKPSSSKVLLLLVQHLTMAACRLLHISLSFPDRNPVSFHDHLEQFS